MGGGIIGGEHWHAKSLMSGEIMYSIQSPTVSPTAGASANTNFRTGLATQLSTNQAIAIHAIRWNIYPTLGVTWADVNNENFQGQVTEALTQTTVSLTEPRILAGAGSAFSSVLDTAVGGQDMFWPFLWTAEFDPPILTIAQNLNVVATSSGSLAFDFHAKLMYTLVDVSEQTLNELVRRISLATQP